jgi:carbon storage regulator CsrA
MFVLSRKSNESIVIGRSCGFERLLKLTVLRVSDGTVKIGIEVTDDVPVHPWEIWERISAGVLPDVSDGPDESRSAQR